MKRCAAKLRSPCYVCAVCACLSQHKSNNHHLNKQRENCYEYVKYYASMFSDIGENILVVFVGMVLCVCAYDVWYALPQMCFILGNKP